MPSSSGCAQITAAGPTAGKRFVEFFTANIHVRCAERLGVKGAEKLGFAHPGRTGNSLQVLFPRTCVFSSFLESSACIPKTEDRAVV
jgi:hypothetical protein